MLDTNGNGKRDAYVEPDQPLDPEQGHAGRRRLLRRVAQSGGRLDLGIVARLSRRVLRVDPGANPPATALTEIYEAADPKAPMHGYSPRGMDIDSNGVVWATLASGHFASFDRRKCKGPLNGPKATGKQCPEGWTLYPFPGPQFKAWTDPGSAEASYYSWVDQHNTFGLGSDVPIATGNGNDALFALVGRQVREPARAYPMGFYAKGMDGRIDDPKAGGKAAAVDHLWHAHAVPHRRRQRHDQQGRAFPAPA